MTVSLRMSCETSSSEDLHHSSPKFTYHQCEGTAGWRCQKLQFCISGCCFVVCCCLGTARAEDRNEESVQRRETETRPRANYCAAQLAGCQHCIAYRRRTVYTDAAVLCCSWVTMIVYIMTASR